MSEKSDKAKLKIVDPNFNFVCNLDLKQLKKEIKNRGNFCSNIQINLSWKEIIKNTLNNTEYFDDER